MFLCEFSITLCLVYKTKCSDQSSDTIRGATQNKLPLDLFFTLGSFWYLYKDANELFKLLSLHLSWRQTQERGPCQSKLTSVYCIQCRQDSGSDCNFYLLLMQHDTRIQRNQVSLSEWMPVGGAYGEMETIRWCLALEAVLMQMFVPLHLRYKRAVFGAWLNKGFVYN